jgi:hypothetical protein
MADAAQAEGFHQQRILVLAPLGRDAEVLSRLLTDSGLTVAACRDPAELMAGMKTGFAAVLIAAEALTPETVAALQVTLAQQPPWSDAQLLLLTNSRQLVGEGSQAIAALRSQTNVIVLERPARALTLVTAVQSALRTRLRQYQMRDLMERECAARRQAEAATKLKDEFLATVSHEMRNPLDAILLWSQLLDSGRLTPAETSNAIRVIERSAKAQSKLIEDLLDISRMVFGKLQLELRECALTPVVLAAVDMLRPRTEAKRQNLTTTIDPDVGIVLADPQRLQQIICNILSNAIKFTPDHGKIEIALRSTETHAVIQIRDTGKGIPPDFLPYVFERFRQSDVGTTRMEGGLGLGMAIAKRLVELHGGTIEVESAGEGQGTTFTLRLPQVSDQNDSSLPSANPLTGIRILLVEDEPDTRLAMTYTLEKAGADVTAVGSAADAIAAVSASKNDRRYDVLLCDIGMPGEDGYSLLAKLRLLENLEGIAPLPAIAVTSYVQEADRARAEAVGFDATLDKPVQLRTMLTTIAELAKRSRRDRVS